MELDHVFLFIDDLRVAEALGQSLGLVETYRRVHAGQGTANICYCFENAFLELLVLTDADEASSAAIARTGLLQRADWRELRTCPLGIAWRLDHQEAPPAFPTWPFRPPYLPATRAIPVAVESDNLAAPLLFQSPGTEAPAAWAPERRGTLQTAAGLRRIVQVLLSSPKGFRPGPTLTGVLAATGGLIEEGRGRDWSLRLRVSRHDGGETILAIAGDKLA